MRPTPALIAGALFFSIVMAACDAHAGGYPEHSIKLIVPTALGSGPDLLARPFGERLAASMGAYARIRYCLKAHPRMR